MGLFDRLRKRSSADGYRVSKVANDEGGNLPARNWLTGEPLYSIIQQSPPDYAAGLLGEVAAQAVVYPHGFGGREILRRIESGSRLWLQNGLRAVLGRATYDLAYYGRCLFILERGGLACHPAPHWLVEFATANTWRYRLTRPHGSSLIVETYSADSMALASVHLPGNTAAAGGRGRQGAKIDNRAEAADILAIDLQYKTPDKYVAKGAPLTGAGTLQSITDSMEQVGQSNPTAPAIDGELDIVPLHSDRTGLKDQAEASSMMLDYSQSLPLYAYYSQASGEARALVDDRCKRLLTFQSDALTRLARGLGDDTDRVDVRLQPSDIERRGRAITRMVERGIITAEMGKEFLAILPYYEMDRDN